MVQRQHAGLPSSQHLLEKGGCLPPDEALMSFRQMGAPFVLGSTLCRMNALTLLQQGKWDGNSRAPPGWYAMCQERHQSEYSWDEK